MPQILLFFWPFKTLWRNLWWNSVTKTKLWRTSATVFRHKLWRNGKSPLQFVTESDIVMDSVSKLWRFPSQLPSPSQKQPPCQVPPPEIVTDFPSQFPSQTDCDGKSPSQFMSQTDCDGISLSQIFRHKKLWRTHHN